MTRKDYIHIAEILRFARPKDVCRSVDWERYIDATVIPWLAADNSAFDAVRFREACGYVEGSR